MRIESMLLMSLLVFGCTAKPQTILPLNEVRVGMSVMEVVDILGPPEDVRFSKDRSQEVWQYCLDERFKPVNNVGVVWFHERRTTGVRIYKSIGFGGCEAFFRKLKWEDAPQRKSGLTKSPPM
ncbi:MAG: hypothetical protein C4530_03790 [Desulfobacteraceae bacterium]|nr:MAG: hypothetical protein C4530_03790 [Desulfobacteraceae bacterium]